MIKNLKIRVKLMVAFAIVVTLKKVIVYLSVKDAMM